MVIADALPPAWLRALTDAAAVLLLLELMVLLLIVTALVFALAFGARWLQIHVVPVLNLTVPRAKQAMNIANQGSERVIRGVAEVYGIRKALETGIQIMLRGRQSPEAAQVAQGDSRTPLAEPVGAHARPDTLRPVAAQAFEPGVTDNAHAAAPVGELSGRPRSIARQPEAAESGKESDRDLNNMAANAG